MLRPLLFSLVPDSLVAALWMAGCGVADDAHVQLPGVTTSGLVLAPHTGALIDLIAACLSGHAPLLLVSDLSHPDVEARAARALDLADGARAPVRFQADGPVFPASSHGSTSCTSWLGGSRSRALNFTLLNSKQSLW